jgi:hypothetical protein
LTKKLRKQYVSKKNRKEELIYRGARQPARRRNHRAGSAGTRSADGKHFMWLYRSGRTGPAMVLYDYSDNNKNAKKDYKCMKKPVRVA